MEQEYIVPGFEDYTVTPSGIVYSYKRGNKKELKRGHTLNWSRRKIYHVTLCKTVDGEFIKKNFRIPRLLLMCKLGRELEWWEQARHIDGDRNHNHMDNLQPGCFVLNAIDDIENGTRQTSTEYLDEAIERLIKIRSQYQSG